MVIGDGHWCVLIGLSESSPPQRNHSQVAKLSSALCIIIFVAVRDRTVPVILSAPSEACHLGTSNEWRGAVCDLA